MTASPYVHFLPDPWHNWELSGDWSSFIFPIEAEALEGQGTSVLFLSDLGVSSMVPCFREWAQDMFVEQMNGIPEACFCVNMLK